MRIYIIKRDWHNDGNLYFFSFQKRVSLFDADCRLLMMQIHKMSTNISIKICPWTQKGINKSISILYCLNNDKNKLENDNNRRCLSCGLLWYRFCVVLSYFIWNESMAGCSLFFKTGTHTFWPMMFFYCSYVFVWVCVWKKCCVTFPKKISIKERKRERERKTLKCENVLFCWVFGSLNSFISFRYFCSPVFGICCAKYMAVTVVIVAACVVVAVVIIITIIVMSLAFSDSTVVHTVFSPMPCVKCCFS